MAIARAFIAADMSDAPISLGIVTVANSRKIVIRDGSWTTIFLGRFSYDASGKVSGVFDAWYDFDNGVKVYETKDIGADAAAMYRAIILEASFGKALRIVFAKDDRIIGSDFDDNVRAFAGNDVIYGRGGDDTANGGRGNDVIHGGAGNDRAIGAAGADRALGGSGNDIFVAGGGNDRAWGGTGDDDLRGQSGRDILKGEDGADRLAGGAGHDLLVGGQGNDSLFGDAGNDRLKGGDDNDLLEGGRGGDNLSGGSGVDSIIGNSGKDILFGGADADAFVFLDATDTKVGSRRRDVIRDFQQGSDKIDISEIDAASSPGDQAFAFIGQSAFAGSEGELRFGKIESKDVTVVSGDVDGDGAADFQIQLSGLFDLTAADFIL